MDLFEDPIETDAQALAWIENAAAQLGLKPTSFCMEAVSNAHIYARLKNGGSITLATMERLREWRDRELTRRLPKALKNLSGSLAAAAEDADRRALFDN